MSPRLTDCDAGPLPAAAASGGGAGMGDGTGGGNDPFASSVIASAGRFFDCRPFGLQRMHEHIAYGVLCAKVLYSWRNSSSLKCTP